MGEIAEPILFAATGLGWLLGAVFIFVWLLIGALKNPQVKGWLGELSVRRRLATLDSRTYCTFHDVLLEKNGDLTQIDHIVVSAYGVFVIETKNYKGWIFGSENGRTWTQTIYKKKSKFQNPLRQNYKHLKFLEQVVGIPMRSMKSVVVFTGECTFKTDLPNNVMRGGSLLNYIRNCRDVVVSPEGLAEWVERVRTANCSGDTEKRHQHLRQVKKMT